LVIVDEGCEGLLLVLMQAMAHVVPFCSHRRRSSMHSR
jgi:hypothetical protein